MNPQNRVEYDKLDFDYSPNGVLCLWQGQPFTGVGIERYADGAIQAESIFRSGFDTQAGRLWYPTGQVQRDAVADDTHHTQRVTEWHENDTLKSHTTYEHGVKIAEQSWDTQGEQISKFGITEDEYHSILQQYRAGNSSAT
jgi:antitoxin component YwqK of YwqJK toxin-antitoxin module